MLEVHEDLAKSLQGGVTTLCRCWKLERTDGAVMGFTDHDRALSFGGVEYEPETGFTRTEMERGLGLSVDNIEAAGALRSDVISEEDVMRGRYDGARITQFVVDWKRPSHRQMVFVGKAGEIRRGPLGFEMEVLGLSEALNRPLGRAYQRLCDAEVGDARCGVALDGIFRGDGEVVGVQDARRFAVSGLGGVEQGWFSLGRLEWTSGGNAGTSAMVRALLRQSSVVVIDLWHAPDAPAVVGDGFRVFAGCDKAAETCRTKFGNFENFRGFPFMPGEDWLTAYPKSGEIHDGGSLFNG